MLTKRELLDPLARLRTDEVVITSMGVVRSVLMGILMASSALIVFSNLTADITYGFLDPRVRVTGARK